MAQKEISPELIQRYLQGKCSPAEAAWVEEWFQSFEAEPDLLSRLSKPEQEELDKRLLHQIKNNIARVEGVPRKKVYSQISIPSSSKPLRQRPLFAVLTGIAASLVLIAGIVFYQHEASWPVGAWRRETTALVTVTNRTVAIQKHVLTDGSVVWLHPSSRLTFTESFAGDKREVQLSGEAFFEVTRNPNRPFLIRSGQLLTKVLGTSFSIKAYENAPSAEVEVVTGKVSVQVVNQTNNSGTNSSGEVLLTPRQKATYRKTNRQLARQDVPHGDKPSMWETANLSFDNASVREIIRALNAHFDIDIQAENENLLNCRVRADFNGQNVPAILEMLGESIEATYQITGKKIRLQGNGCNQNP